MPFTGVQVFKEVRFGFHDFFTKYQKDLLVCYQVVTKRGFCAVHEYHKVKLGDVSKLIKIQVIGPFQAIGPDGENLTPTGAKAFALLAILALTDGKYRPRRFLEKKLWSGRAPEQAGQSLR